MNVLFVENKVAGTVMIHYLYPVSTREEPGKEFLEFAAFKFFTDSVTGKTMSVHYAKNIERAGATRQGSDVQADIQRTRMEAIRVLAPFPPITE